MPEAAAAELGERGDSARETDAPFVSVRGLAHYFDVSKPWLNRTLEGAPRLILKAVDGISFDIPRGKTFALVGESGCGKSTVARCVVGLHRPSAGTIRLDGVDMASLKSRHEIMPLRRRLQMIFQDPYASLNPRWRVSAIVAEPIVAHRLMADRKAIRARVDELLRQVGLTPEDGAKYPHEFSGGQRQRVSIARALASNPEFLVCDEPTSALDVSVQAQILNLMKDLQKELGLTYLLISHDLAVVYNFADEVGVMYLGRLVEWGPGTRLFAAPRHPYTRMLLDAIPDLEMSGRARIPVAGEVPDPIDPPSGCSFHPRCPHANERCRTQAPETITVDGIRLACHGIEEGRIAAVARVKA
jgi:peptide/nickel transport system ATP-binding protein